MHDFPPQVTTFWSAGRAGTPAEAPDTRSPARFLVWLLRRQPDVIAVSLLYGVLWQLPLALGPWIFGRMPV